MNTIAHGHRWRWIAALAVIIVLVAAGAFVWGSVRHRKPTLVGAVLTTPGQAYDFQLTDQDGRPVSLAGLRGKAIALTFLYTNCPDVCPLIAESMHRTYELLGDATTQVAFLAVSVDPRGDNPISVRRFLALHHVQGELTYLLGSPAQLKPVWEHYYVGTDAAEVNPAAVSKPPAALNLVDHTAIVYVIDGRGQIRTFLPANFDPKDLATDLKILTGEAGQ
jgi:protein SCO1/2